MVPIATEVFSGLVLIMVVVVATCSLMAYRAGAHEKRDRLKQIEEDAQAHGYDVGFRDGHGKGFEEGQEAGFADGKLYAAIQSNNERILKKQKKLPKNYKASENG